MPIYEYRCQACGHELEKLQRMSDDPLTDCPACGKAQLKRLVSAAGFRLKGGGWYETDFKQGNKRNLAGGDSDSGKKSDAGGDGASSPDKSAGESTKKTKSDKKKPSTTGKAAPA
ncbi:MAG: zinc ribbon domain-containing protein [Xanthomonadales bacterium]|jgi:putative FmdB family regulatory protein|nr:zinc ribbon domain-containing protein [Xanthomonadales bacterium]